MTQRQRRSLEQDIQQTYNELNPYFQEFNEFLGENMNSSDSASLIMSMITKVSSPITGIQLVRNNLAEMNFQYMNLYDMIINKAEMLYYQSFMQDLRRIKNDEVIVQNSREQIKKCIQQLNWKLSVDSASILNESQEVEENKELMKFFEGIRNYQKWQEGIKFESLQQLKQRANQIQKEVIFKKGFIISKIQTVSEKVMRRNFKEFFIASKKNAMYVNLKRILKKITTRKLQQAFSQVYLQSISPERGNYVLFKIFESYYHRKFLGETRKIFLTIKTWKDNLLILSKSIKQFKNKRELGLKHFAFNKLNLKQVIKASKITESVQRLAQLSKKIIVRHMFKKFNIIPKVIFAKLQQAYFDRTQTVFKLLKQNYVEAKLRRPNISERLKGKILVSLNKYEREPLSIKKMFDRWYMNSHSEKYTKKIYNIWLQGNINKFVVFMRFKNLCDNVNKQMIGREMQNFIKVVCEKYDKYEEHNKKLMLKKWIDNHRRVKKVEKLVKTLKKLQIQTENTYAKYALEKFTQFCKRRQIIKNYLSKYLLNFISNRKKAMEKWSNINNIKKSWGKSKLRAILLNITHQMNETAKETLNVFIANRMEGRRKKLAQYHRTFSQYGITLEKIIQIWRYNSSATRMEQQVAIQNITQAKSNSISEIALTKNKVEALNIRDIIGKFKQYAQVKARKINNIENSFMRIIIKQENYLKKDILDILSQKWREGKFKKQRLVIQLVHSNIIKQKLSLTILKNNSKYDTQLLKRQQLTRIYDILQQKVKQNLTIFNKQLFVGKVLQKILINYTSNIQLSLVKWKALPLRMRWNLRNKVLKLNNTLSQLRLNRFRQSQQEFKNANHQAKTKKKRGVYIMANKFQIMLRKFFQKYHLNSLQLKEKDKLSRITHFFETSQRITKQHLDPVMKAKAEWPKRLHYFQRLNQILHKKFRSYFLSWNNIAKSITYQNKIKDEKKKRFLQNLSRVIENRYLQQTKSSIESFSKNRRIYNLQINFLKKLCEGRAGKLYKGFSVWKSMPVPKNKQFIRKCTQLQAKLTRYAHNILRQSLKPFKQNRQDGKIKKRQIIYLFLQNSCMSMRKYFEKWKVNKNIMTFTLKNKRIEQLFEASLKKENEFMSLLMSGNQAQQKRKALGIIQNWWLNQERYYLKKWHKNISNLKMMDINKRHLLRNLNKIMVNSQKQFLKQNVIKKFTQNRTAALDEKYKKKTQAILKAIDCQNAYKRQLLNQTVDKLKFSHYWGNFKKNNIFHKFLKEKIGTVHNILAFWNTLANQAKEAHKQRIVTQNFDLFNETIKANYRLILSKTRDEAIKKHYLDRLFNTQQLKFKGYFNLWRQRVKQLNILGQLDKKAKASILQRINKILNATSSQAVTSIIKKFHQNFKITQIQKKFMDKILQTKSGKLINAFNNWKAIPMNMMRGKYKNYQKFYFNLEAFYKNRIKKVNDVFKEYSEDGNLMKKQSILKLFEMTSLGIRRFYNRWSRFTRQKHSLMQVHYTLKAFANVEGTLQSQYRTVFRDKHAYQVKLKAIQKLVEATKQKLSIYIQKWRQSKENLKVQANFVKNQKVKALKNLNNLTMNSQMAEAIKIIKMFEKNRKMIKISKNFLTRLMLTKTGKVIQFFSVMKTLPDAKLNKRKKKGIIFESRLYNFVQKRLRDTLNPFKENTYDAQTKMKYCIGRLIRACMGQNQKKFLIWRNVVREAKILKHTSLFQKMFNNIQKEVKQNFGLVLKDTKGEIQKKKALCRKLITNSSFVQHHAFLLWRQSCRIEDLNTVKKQVVNKNHLKNLESVVKQHQNKQVIQAINEFRRLLQLRNVQEYTYIKQYKNKRCLEFYNSMKLMEKNRKSAFVDALKKSKTDAMLGDQSQKLQAVFKAMQFSCQKNINYLFKTSEQTALLQRVFNRLYENQKINMDKAVSLWKEKKNALIFEQIAKKERKRRSLKLINTIYLMNNNKKITNAINKFRTNKILKEMKKRICLKILARKTNNYTLSFKNWKNVPYQQAKKLKPRADKFEKGLINFLKNNLKETLWAFKQNRLQGVFKKQNAVRNIVRCRLMQNNRVFFNWRKYNNESKIKDKIVTLDKFLNISETVFRDSLYIFQGSKVNDQRKIRAATHLFNNNVQRLRSYVKIWRRSAKNIKFHLFEKHMRNFNPEDFNKRLLKISWLMIVKKKDMQMMKGYINSLWKWKMSNIQANYYSKFIKIMKESEEMIKFSNLLNKKIYQNIHHSFRNILSTGNQKTNRKREIVEKYLMRRFRNYFIAFKNGTLHTEINVWKSKYTDVIKAKILYQILSTLILKSKFIAFANLKNYETYTNKIQSMERSMINFQQGCLRGAFEKIKHTAHRKIFQIASILEAKSKKERLNECFQLLKQKSKIQRLIHHVSMALLQKYLHAGFNAINKKKQRVIKSKLSIILLQTLIQTAQVDDKRNVIHEFRINRLKNLGMHKMFKVLDKKSKENTSVFYERGQALIDVNKFLQRLKRAEILRKIVEKQDFKLQKEYLNKMRKKENKWMELAIQKFATRASLRSSPAISLWRLKTYIVNS